MLTLEEKKDKYRKALIQYVATRIKWAGYDKALAIRTKWLNMYNGTNHELYVNRKDLKDNPETYKRKFYHSYNPCTPDEMISVGNDFMQVFTKVADNTCTHAATNQKPITELNALHDKFQDKKKLIDLLAVKHQKLNMYDPNAAIVINLSEDERPYIKEISCDRVAVRAYELGTLDYIIYETEHIDNNNATNTYTVVELVSSISKIQIYEYAHKPALPPGEFINIGAEVSKLNTIASECAGKTHYIYEVENYASSLKNKLIPACIVGYVDSGVDNVYNSVCAAGESAIIDIITYKRIIDQMVDKVLFYHKSKIVIKCKAMIKKGNTKHRCEGKYNSSKGLDCKTCSNNGTLHKVKQSDSGDLDLFRVESLREADGIDLSKLNYTEIISTDTAQFIKDCLKEAQENFANKIFSQRIQSKGGLLSYKNNKEIQHKETTPKNNVLATYSVSFSEVYKHVVAVNACYLGINNLQHSFEFEADFETETTANLTKALESKAPAAYKHLLERKLLQKQCNVNSERYKLTVLAQDRSPFLFLSREEVLSILPSLPETSEFVIKFNSHADIMCEVQRLNVQELSITQLLSAYDALLEKKIKEIRDAATN